MVGGPVRPHRGPGSGLEVLEEPLHLVSLEAEGSPGDDAGTARGSPAPPGGGTVCEAVRTSSRTSTAMGRSTIERVDFMGRPPLAPARSTPGPERRSRPLQDAPAPSRRPRRPAWRRPCPGSSGRLSAAHFWPLVAGSLAPSGGHHSGSGVTTGSWAITSLVRSGTARPSLRLIFFHALQCPSRRMTARVAALTRR